MFGLNKKKDHLDKDDKKYDPKEQSDDCPMCHLSDDIINSFTSKSEEDVSN